MATPVSTLPTPPPAGQTLEEWKEYVECFGTEESNKEFAAIVEAFAPDAEKAHAAVLAWRDELLKHDKTANWAGPKITPFFLSLPYLLPWHTNFPFVFEPDALRSEDLCSRAARVSAGFVAAHDALVHGTYGTDTIKGQELCMDAQHAYFGAERVPGAERDTFTLARTPPTDIAVLCCGHVYAVRNAWTPTHGPAPVAALRAALRSVVAHAEAQASAGHAGLLTCLERRPTARVFAAVRAASPTAAATLEELARSLFVVCLDTAPLPNADTRGMINHVARAVREGDTCSRWYHKPLQLIFTRTGGGGSSAWHNSVAAGMVLEHSHMDGTAGALLAERALAASRALVLDEQSDAVLELEWAHCPLPIETAVVSPLLDGRTLTEAAGPAFPRDTRMFTLDAFGRDACVSRKASPDACFVASVHLAASRMFGRPMTMQHVVSMRAHAHGRGAPNMVASPRLLSWLAAMGDTARVEEHAPLLRTVLTELATRVALVRSGKRDVVRLLGALQERTPDAAVWTRPELLTLNLPAFLLSGGRVSEGIYMFGSNNWFDNQFSLGYTIHPESVRVYAALRGDFAGHGDALERELPRAMADVAALL